MNFYFQGLEIVRFIFEKGLAAIYFVGFLTALFQFKPLLGEKGLLPTTEFLKITSFKLTPSIFHYHYSDRFLTIVVWIGLMISAVILCGALNYLPWWVYIITWLILWFLYLSLVSVGQTFYSFGWESMLCEAGFFAAFLGPAYLETSIIPILALRWMLFRVEFGAGLIKLRHDPCWRNLTCLFYHYETQPMPGPLSWYFHRLPKFSHKFGVLFSHFVQVVVPFGIFAPQPIAQVAGLLIIFHQLWLVFCGNYSWLNWLTIVLAFTALSDSLLNSIVSYPVQHVKERPLAFDVVLYALLLFTLFLSWKPLLNLFSKQQLMNYCWNSYHLVGAYGAFGSVTKERYEIIIEGTNEEFPDSNSQWKEYEFKGKPGNLKRIPRQYAPYHLRLDWMMWFLPFSVMVNENRIQYISTQYWFLRFLEKLLQGDKPVLSLINKNPFENEPPKRIRCRYYRYQSTTFQEKKETGNIWKRTLIGDYLQPLSISQLRGIMKYES